jgi:3-oxoacyl-[acyl-carrier-protein] synthase III
VGRLKTIFAAYDQPIYIGALAASLGETVNDFGEIPVFSQDPKLTAFLRSMKVQHYRSSASSPAELARDSARQTLARSRITPADIDVVIYVSESLWEDRFYLKDQHWLLEELGLSHAYLIGTFLRACSNIHSALRIAANLCRNDEAGAVLIVTTDKAKTTEERVVPPKIGVTSDSAASLILSRQMAGADFQVLCNAQCALPSMQRLDESAQYMLFLKCVRDGVAAAVDRCTEGLGCSVQDLRRLVSNNYNMSLISMFAAILGVSDSLFVSDNIARYGHCYSADNVINLIHLLEQEALAPGDLTLNLSSGPGSWGASILARV